MIPKTLLEMQEYLQQNPVKLSMESRDGRVNSSEDEDLIIDHLRKGGFGEDVFLTLPARSWCDIWLVDENLPVNIKSTTCSTADNAGNFLLLNWCFTNRKIGFDTKPNARTDIEHLVNSVSKDPKRDYWFLVVNKKDPKEIIINSVRGLEKITGNSSNMPFQVNWGHNKVFITRPYSEIRKIYIELLKESYRKHPYHGLSSL